MDSIQDITLVQLFTSYIFILILIAIVKWLGIRREKEILIASFRMSIQLALVGYLLTYVFENPNPFITVFIILFMQAFAVYNVYNRVKTKISTELKKIIAFALFLGTTLSMLYFDFIVIQFTPWYDPRYFIPIAGMIIGNSMTGITLGISTLMDGMHSKRQYIESSLMLGATPKEASRFIVRQSFDAAILPTVNSMVGTGIVFLPGMMTGVILSGADPMIAIKYQIVILLGITASVSLSILLLLQLGYKTFYNNKAQLKKTT
ncbi:ABC transporter permease [Chengkuizengella axinellae]|uniref:Iron export ABC transporter permease subunit FetB n=1 Tax=Chengkuizengella axinellae TaxID=3064388 RepID=A0ABT9J187_9BACL|nr:iron export ABC transporter permease subunit FetB [Chengkuizengella sp. 2205SS18-9]MDP5275363.1 iron export ABC transporter permease subunit FetB [Chengkuizengella sp. 2205SS18-9]